MADDGGLIVSNIDLSYMGVHSIWTNNLGKMQSFNRYGNC